MAIKISIAEHPPTCLLSQWAVDDAVTFVKALAWLYLRKPSHAMRIMAELEPGAVGLFGNVVANAIDLLRYKTSDLVDDLNSADAAIKRAAEKKRDVRITHRDGLLFQHISWLASRLQYPSAAATPPHVRKADKGFDGFLVEFTDGADSLSRVVLCEDKASPNPRQLVTSSIWPEIRSIVARERDLEILDAVSALLSNVDEARREEVIKSTIWERARCFRVALTVTPGLLKDGSYQHLFDGFENQVTGDVAVRRAEVLCLPDVRQYLEQLAEEIIVELEKL